jgi:histidinol-phosphatase (PHP family)
MMTKIDGHTHTELCPHGSGEKTAAMIERAIQLGFDNYCITEHAPLPQRFVTDYRGDPAGLTTASLSWKQLDEYFLLTDQLKKFYHAQIKISVGFEVDYLPGYETEIKEFLNQVGPKTEQNILSIHFMPGKELVYGVLIILQLILRLAFPNGLITPKNCIDDICVWFYKKLPRI